MDKPVPKKVGRKGKGKQGNQISEWGVNPKKKLADRGKKETKTAFG